MQHQVCVVIAAKDAASTIAVAIGSALDQRHVSRVVVVDDGSSDATSAVAKSAAGGDPRFTLIRCALNRGPSAARNLAIAQSDEPFIAILDADDYFLPNRFEGLLAIPGWDMIADNIAFVQAIGAPVEKAGNGSVFRMQPAAFIRGNISRPGVVRGEYGFLKPLVRRDFLERHSLHYDETIRLGEDYDLYVRILLAGGRFDVVNDCGYCALVRPDSLSGKHRTADLERLVQVDQHLLAMPHLASDVARALRDHLRQASAKFHHRRFLDQRRSLGLAGALRQLGGNAEAWQSVVGGIARDKLAGLSGQSVRDTQPVRYLLSRTG